MNVHHTLICFFFLSLQDGNTEVTDQHFLHYGVTGGNVTAGFSFTDPGTWKIFCKEKCEGGNILITTPDVRDQRGRYSIKYKYEGGSHVLYVSITKLTQSDSGLYSCGLGGSLSSASYTQFGLLVAEALLDGNHDPSQQKHFYKETGSSLTVGCSFKLSGRRKLFCRGECGGDKTLIQTDHDRAKQGRYSIVSVSGVLYVTITQLTKSDSGQYRCSLSGTSSSSFREFEITVTDATTTTSTSTSTSTTTTTTTTTTAAQSFSSSSGSSTPSLTLTGTTEQSEGTTSTDVLLYVGLTLAVTIILLSVAVLIFCKKRSSKAKDPPVETEDAAVTEAEDDSNKLTYSEVTFSKRTFGSPKSASSADINEVLYSAPRVHVSSDTRDDPLYSSVA